MEKQSAGKFYYNTTITDLTEEKELAIKNTTVECPIEDAEHVWMHESDADSVTSHLINAKDCDIRVARGHNLVLKRCELAAVIAQNDAIITKCTTKEDAVGTIEVHRDLRMESCKNIGRVICHKRAFLTKNKQIGHIQLFHHGVLKGNIIREVVLSKGGLLSNCTIEHLRYIATSIEPKQGLTIMHCTVAKLTLFFHGIPTFNPLHKFRIEHSKIQEIEIVSPNDGSKIIIEYDEFTETDNVIGDADMVQIACETKNSKRPRDE